MTEKELLKQLNTLKNVKPNSDWKQSNRDILCSQIFNSSNNIEVESSNKMFDLLFDFVNSKRNFAKNLSHSFVVLFLVLVVVLGGGIMSLKAAQNTKPGDSLYIAKIISEKARASLTFDEKEKAKLSVEFASNRAKEIKQVLKENDNNKEEKVEKLTKNLKKEIKAARERVEKIIAKKTDNKEDNLNISSSAKKIDNTKKEEKSEKQQSQEDDDKFVFSANLSKDKKGIQISEKENTSQSETSDISTSTLTNKNVQSTNEDKNDIDANPEEILEEVGKLLEEENYDEILNKLEVVDKIIDDQYNINSDTGGDEEGEVKGEFESATTTQTEQTEVEEENNNNDVIEENNEK